MPAEPVMPDAEADRLRSAFPDMPRGEAVLTGALADAAEAALADRAWPPEPPPPADLAEARA